MHLECVFCAHGSFQDRWNCFPGPLEAKFPIFKKYYFFLQKSPIWPYLVPAAKSWYARMAIYNRETKISKIQSTFLLGRSYSSSPCIGGQIRPLWKYPLDIAWGPFWVVSHSSKTHICWCKTFSHKITSETQEIVMRASISLQTSRGTFFMHGRPFWTNMGQFQIFVIFLEIQR